MINENLGRLTRQQLLAYAAPVLPLSMMLAPVGSILPVFYAKHTAVGLSAIGLVMLVTRIFDALADQLVGYLSDATQSRFGPRKPWMVVGTAVCMVGVYFFFNPPADAGVWYFFFSLTALYLGWSMVSVPQQAWGAEIATDYRERAKVASYTAMLGPLGFVAVLSVTFLPVFKTTEIGADVVSMMGLITILALPVAVALALWIAPRGPVTARTKSSVAEVFKAVRRNRIFWHFMAFSGLGQLALGLISATSVVYMDLYLGLGDKVSIIFIINMLVMVATVPIWLKVVYRIGKHRALAVSGFLNVCLIPLILLVEPGPQALYPLVGWIVVLGAGGGANAIAINAIMADIVDYDALKTGVARAGNYYAFMGLLTKATAAIGGGAAFWILAAFGFDAKATSQTELAVIGLKFSLIGLPLMLGIVSIWLMLRFPLDARRHAVIRRRLDQRAARLARHLNG